MGPQLKKQPLNKLDFFRKEKTKIFFFNYSKFFYFKKIKSTLRLRGQSPTQRGAGSPRFLSGFFGDLIQALHRLISKFGSLVAYNARKVI